VIGTLALGPRWEPLTCYSDARWAMSRDHGARNTRSSFGQQSLWCWSSWRSLCGAGGRENPCFRRERAMFKWIMPRGMSRDGRAGDNSAAWISKILQYHRCRARARNPATYMQSVPEFILSYINKQLKIHKYLDGSCDKITPAR
jgi:hypothetical protein